MFSIFYDFILFLLGLAALPKLLWQWVILGKYRESLSERFGFNLPYLAHQEDSPIIWIHAVSLGETRAVVSLYKLIRKALPHARIVISSTTETGHAEALRSMPEAAAHIFLPLDFYILSRRAVKKLNPSLLILVESDFWYHLLHYSKSQGAKIALVNGKVSDRSARRFAFFAFFTKRLFAPFDCLCMQNERYKERFLNMGISADRLHITGNLKLDHAALKMSPEEILAWKNKLGITEKDRVLVLGSTHEPEEEWLLSALDIVWKEIPELKVLIVPRHPERFERVAAQLKARGLTVIAYSQIQQKTGQERVVLIDAMGILHKCYELAEAAIVGGSFVAHVGGHNIFEPVECGVPAFFGPHMHSQADLTRIVLESGAGRQISLADLPKEIIDLLLNPIEAAHREKACLKLAKESRGAAQRTWNLLKHLL